MKNRFTEYIIALTNLYGLVHKDKVVEIYNSQNDELIDSEDYFEDELNKYYVYVYMNHFVHITIMEVNKFKLMLWQKADKPYYIPEQQELLKYSNMPYYEKPKQYYDLYNFIKKNFFNSDAEKAEELCKKIIWECQDNFNIEVVFDHFDTFDMNFKDEKQVNEVVQMVMELLNNVRLWENNGHTPNEIFEKYEKQNLSLLPNEPFGAEIIDLNSRRKNR